MTDYTKIAQEKIMWYFNRRYNGYIAEDTRYTVIRDDERYFTARFVTTINAGADFYIDSYDRIVIVFNEYEAAPGYMGCPEFIIPEKCLRGCLYNGYISILCPKTEETIVR